MEPPPQTPPVSATGLLSRLRRRRAVKKERAATAVRQRVLDRLAGLGPDWQVLDARPYGLPDSVDLLVIGPGGIFTVDLKRQGRTKIMLAGDVIQIDGRRPPLVAMARRGAKRAAAALSRAAGTSIPVIPIIVFVGSGELSMQGLPRRCIVAHDRELARILSARGKFLSSPTVARLRALADEPATWQAPTSTRAAAT